MAPKVVVAIPCYNCAAQIGRVLEGFDQGLLSRVTEVVAIDNRSTDDTAARALSAMAKLGPKGRVLQNDKNYGLGGSHKVAFQYAAKAGADYVAILHGDNQATTRELHFLIDEAVAHAEAAAVLGARFMSDSKLEGYSLVRTAGNRALNGAYTVLSGRRTFDLGSGLNLFKVSELPPGYLGFSDAFTFNMDLLLAYYRRGSRLRFVPITWSETDQVSNAKTFKVGWIALKTLLKWRVGFDPSKRAGGKPYTYRELAR